MKSICFTLLGMLLAFSGFAQLNLTVDVSCSDNPNPAEVRMTGPFWGWDPAGGPIAVDNLDGTWTVTLDPAPTADMEYLWINDGVQENLIPAVQNGGTCAPVTDGASYANRLWTVGSPDVTDDTYAQCSACGSGCTDTAATNYDPAATSDDGSCVYAVTFIVDMNQAAVAFTTPEVNGTYNGWCGGCNALADPDLDGVWEGTFNVPAGAQQFKFAADSWAVQENFVGGEPCTITDGGNVNRVETITGPTTIGPYCWNECAACASTLNLTVDASCIDGNPTPAEVRMTGPFWGWDPAGGPIATDNLDGTWTVSLDPIPGADMEYLWVVDGVQENLIPAVQNGGTCAPVTDGATYANRLWTLGSPDVTDNTYGQCSSCGAGCTDSAAANYDPAATEDDGSCVYAVTFIVDMNETGVAFTTPEVNGTYNGWCGGCNALADPDLDGIWEGTFNVPGGDQQFKFAADSWAVQENFVGGEPCTINDGGNINRVVNIAGPTTVGPYCWNECFACGVAAGCMDPAATNYDPTATVDDGSCTYMVTFIVDMNQVVDPFTTPEVNGTYNGWCGGCNQLADPDLDGVWEGTFIVPGGIQEFKFAADGWTIQENFDGSEPCTVTDGVNTNRFVDVTGDVTYGPVCWNSCDICDIGPEVTFQVDMNDYGVAFASVNVSGTWNAFCADCNPLTDDDLDGVWTGTYQVPPGDHVFKYQVDAWTDEETLDPAGSCNQTEGGFTNRSLSVANAPLVLDVVCWSSCYACPGTLVPGCNNPSAVNFDAVAQVNDGSCIFNVTFQLDMNEYAPAFTTAEVNGTFNGWCGNCNPMDDSDGNGIWELTIQLQEGYYEYKHTTDNFATEEIFVGGESCTTNNFGFINRYIQITGNTVLDLVCWDSCEGCATTIFGCDDTNAQNYDPAATVNDGSCSYLVTFRVDMNQVGAAFTIPEVNGTYNGWCGGCNQLADPDLDGVWEGTFTVPSGAQEYKFAADGWAIQENFVGGEPCTITTDGFTNRVTNITGNTILPVVCWESCTACPPEFITVTFRVDMSNEVVDASGVHIVGDFQGWDPAATPMSYVGYGIYEYSILLNSNATNYFKYVNGNDFAMSEIVPVACGVDDGGGNFNREVNTGGADTTLDVVCFSACEACAGCTDPFSVEYNPFAGSDDGSCLTPVVQGCTYVDADNYNPSANDDDGSCTFTVGSDCPEDLNNDGIVNAADLLQFLGAFGSVCP